MEKNVLIEILKTSTGYGAHAPHYPGCVATGKTLDETRDRMLKALDWHIKGMLEDNAELPPDSEYCEIVSVKMPEAVHA
ncbi:MAG: type II toxin-antitoxin system HicB family antitoxin [Planctomycetota bacterium]|jgi:predicted RNase H-like HicB family nuclease|nr:type II toxin-antitoxin system HicB family antitoxin [Planctomycetota bacterium]